MTKLDQIIALAHTAAPPGMQQDDQDFEDWKKDEKSGTITGVYFSWKHDRRFTCTIHVKLDEKKVTIRLGDIEINEALSYVFFAKELETL